MCEHNEFEVNAKVVKLTDKEGGPVIGFRLDAHIRCSICGQPFEFVHPIAGFLNDQITISADKRELRSPIVPSKEIVN